MAWIKNINQILTDDYEDQYRGVYVKRSYHINDEKGNTIAHRERYTRMFWHSDEDRLREIGVTWDRPDKQTMRMRWVRKNTPRIEWYSDLGHGVNIYRGVDRYIEKHIGKSFARTYSNFLFKSKYMRWRDSNIGFYGYNSARRVFMSYFNRTYPGYYIDSDGIIQSVPSKSRPKNKDLKIYLPTEQRTVEYYINPQRGYQAEQILREYFPEHNVNKFKEHFGLRTSQPINIRLFLGHIDPCIETEILKKIRSFHSNKHQYIDTLNTWLIERHWVYIDRIIKAGTREWYVEKCKLKRAQKYSHKHKPKLDTELYDAILVARKHEIYDCDIREKIIYYANFYKNKQKALRKKPTYFYKESIGCTGDLLY